MVRGRYRNAIGGVQMGVLSGVRVLDLSWGSAGPLATMLLADHGADVLKIAPPGGDPFRDLPAYRVWSRGKRCATLDLKRDEDREQFLGLAAAADVLVESYAPGVTERLGVAYDQLAKANPRMVYCSVTGYGRRGRLQDRPGYDGLVQARTSLQMEQRGYYGGPILHVSGLPEPAPPPAVPDGAEQTGHREGPIFLAVPWPSIGAAYLATAGVSAALLARERTGLGQHVETSLLQGVLLCTALTWQRAEHLDYPGYRLFYWDRAAPKGLFECADGGWIHTMGVTSQLLERLLEERSGTSAAAYVKPPRGRVSVGAGMTYAEGLQDALDDYPRSRELFKLLPRDEWLPLLWRADATAQPVRSPEEALADPELLDMGIVTRLIDPELGATNQVGVAYTLERCPAHVQGPARCVDQTETDAAAWWSTHAVPGSAPPTTTAAAEIDTARAAAPAAAPLAGVLVLDLGSAVAGPFGPQLLGDLGADVIKVDRAVGEPSPYMQGHVGSRRGKRNLAVDLGRPEGIEIIHHLAERADVVHHNMRPGVAERLGIDYETLRRLNPRLIYCHVTGYGSSGSRARLPGSDQMGNALAGSGYEGGAVAAGRPPIWYTTVFGDHGTGTLSAIGVIQALYHREKTGLGQKVETSILASAMLYNSYAYAAEGAPNYRPRLDRDQNGLGALYRLYRCRAGWLCIAAVTDQHWAALCRATGHPELTDDPRFGSVAERRRHDAVLAAVLAERFAAEDADTWFERLDAAGVPCEVSSDRFSRELFDDPDLKARGWVTSYTHPLLGRLEQFGHLIDFSRTPGRIAGPPPLVGQHTREILTELGYSAARIDELRRVTVVHCEPRDGPLSPDNGGTAARGNVARQ